ncbi:hypothetical protein [Streptomyces sp. NPDC056672]|uniref:hypothetical protein n=1 Tax=Streptomyces sp. NPDC056672 TaxID=3345906 RepID=UPI003692A6F2
MTDVAGWFRFSRYEHGREVLLSEWRVTTEHSGKAHEVARLLGGEPKEWESSDTDRWEVLTASSTVRIAVDGATGHTLSFRLAACAELGPFRMHFETWTLSEIMGDVVDRLSTTDGTPHAELALQPMDVKTLSGMYLRYMRPVLTEIHL